VGLFNVYTVSNAYRSDYFQYLSEQWSNDTDEFTGAWNRSSHVFGRFLLSVVPQDSLLVRDLLRWFGLLSLSGKLNYPMWLM